MMYVVTYETLVYKGYAVQANVCNCCLRFILIETSNLIRNYCSRTCFVLYNTYWHKFPTTINFLKMSLNEGTVAHKGHKYKLKMLLQIK